MGTKLKTEDFEKIYKDTYYQTLKFIVIKCGSFNDINDLIQDTYVELYRILNKKKILELEQINSYILGIANNIIKRHYSKRKHIHLVEKYNEDDEIDIKDDFDLEQDFITKENVKDIWNYIKNKNIITAKIFYLYYVLDLKIVEISQELDLKESNVKNKIYRTLRELKKIYEKESD